MSKTRKLVVVLGAPLALATFLGGAAAFASQAGGSTDDPAVHGSHSGYHRISFGDGTAHDGSDCPHDKGNGAGASSVSPSVY